MSLVAVAFAAGSGFAAEKQGTASVKADAQAKPADAAKGTQNKTDAGKQPDATKKTGGAASSASAQAGAATQAKRRRSRISTANNRSRRQEQA